MQRRNLAVVGVVAVIAAIAVWRCRGGSDDADPTPSGSSEPREGSARGVASQPRPDPKTLTRSSLAGTVTLEGAGPLARARVCAKGWSNELEDELMRAPVCTDTDDAGHKLADLYPAVYTVSASAKPHRPTVHRPAGDSKRHELRLAANEHKTGIDIAMRPGGVEMTGVVSDLTGGSVGNARVWIEDWGRRGGSAIAATETDAQGKFSLWVNPGHTRVTADADGYAAGSESAAAPGKVEILLTPESSLAGIVVDAATNQPIEGARVDIEATDFSWDFPGGEVFSDAQGKFRVERLTPGRYVATSRTDCGYGRTEGSTLVGLGQHADGVVVKLWPARRIEGKVVIGSTKQACEHGGVSLRDDDNHWVQTRRRPDGTVFAEGVRPGSYEVTARCEGYQSRDKYERIVVADKDLAGLVWEVDPGATVRGRVITASGAVVESAEITARSASESAKIKGSWAHGASDRDGRFELTGMRPGKYKLDVDSDRGVAPKDGIEIEVAAGATIDRDIRLDDAGAIKGSVVDGDGKPVTGIDVRATSSGNWGGESAKSDDTGAFTLQPLAAGDYRVVASRRWSDQLRKPGTTDDAKQGERASVRAGQTATVKLVVESQSGSIKGTVVDFEGKPVADAFVSAARESDAAGAMKARAAAATRWSWDERPVITTTDGAFVVEKLSPGQYTVRAYRKGGGEAIAEHVATGGTAKLQIRPTGSIEGTVKRGTGPVDDLAITVKDLSTWFQREESFYKTGGRFVVRDLPKGHFQIEAKAGGGLKTLELDLGEGEAKAGVDLELEALISITGRLVELGTTKPVPGVRMMAMLAKGGGGFSFTMGEDLSMISDDAGKFTIKNVPTGQLQIRAWPRESDYASVSVIRTVQAAGDIGDIAILKKRVKKGEPVGEHGIKFVDQPPDTPPDKREYKVSFIDPAGPAAKTDLKVGDIIITIDGIDIAGEHSSRMGTLVRAAPGTKLALGLARNATVTITLAAP